MKDFWVLAATSSIENIALHPYGHPELTYLSQGDVSGNLAWQMDDYVGLHYRGYTNLLTMSFRLALREEIFY
jgi:hypothetical protein